MTQSKANKEGISLILPTYNEEGAIVTVLKRCKNVLETWGAPYEIIVVDDCSSDRTVELAEAFGGIRVIRRNRNGGSGASRKTGIRAAHYPIIAMIDADETYTPEDLPRLFARMSDCDMVSGARDREMGTYRAARTLAKFIMRKLAEFLSGTRIPDLNTGMKVFRREVMRKYLWAMPDGFSCVTSMTLSFLTNGYTVAYEPTTYNKRVGKSKFHPIRDTAKYFLTIVRMIIFFRPLKFFAPFSATFFLFALGKALLSLFVFAGRMQASDIVLMISGVLFFIVGMITELIVAMSNQISQLEDAVTSIKSEQDSKITRE